MVNHGGNGTASRQWRELEHGTDAMVEALAACPEAISTAVSLEPPALREPPPELLGRENDIKAVKNRVLRVTDPTEGRGRVEGTVIVAAPGAGKTSLLDKVERDLENAGTTVIKLTALDVTSPEAFSKKVQEQPPWSTRAARTRALNAVAHGGARFIDELVDLGATAGLKRIFGIKTELDVGAVERTLTAWQEGRTAGTQDVIKLLAQTSEKGVVVVIDEAQELIEFKDDPKAKDSIRRLLKIVNDPQERTDNGVPNATLLAAGMCDTDNVISLYTTVPPECHRLDPVGPATVREMIRRAIQASTAANRWRDQAEMEWTEQLAERYGDWTRHAQCAGEVAKEVLNAAGEDALTKDWGMPLLIDTTEQHRNKLHDRIIDKGMKYGVLATLQELVAQMLWRNGNRVTAGNLRAAAKRLVRSVTILQGSEPNDQRISQQTDVYLQQMIRSGLIDRRGTYYRAPIPSIISYMTKSDPMELDSMLEIMTMVGLSTDRPTSE